MSINTMKVQSDTFDTAGLAAGLAPVNTEGFPGPCSLLRIINNSASIVAISYDGVNIADEILANSNISLNFQANAGPNNQSAKLPSGTIVYVSSAAATAGNLRVSCYYQPTTTQ